VNKGLKEEQEVAEKIKGCKRLRRESETRDTKEKKSKRRRLFAAPGGVNATSSNISINSAL